MIKLGVNTVLFKAFSLAEAARAIRVAGYDGMELSAISGMCQHLELDNWKAQKSEIQAIAADNDLKLLSMEEAGLGRDRLLMAFEAGAEIGIPIINVGPGGTAGDEDSLKACLDILADRAALAEPFGVTLCVKAHVGAAIHDTPTTLMAMDYVKSPAFGIDMDPSHIYRAGELPELALPMVISRVKHIHIRDCKGNGPSPGTPQMQACGRGDIDLPGYFAAMLAAGYDGPVCLEVIGPDQDSVSAMGIAAESCGYMNACLKMLK